MSDTFSSGQARRITATFIRLYGNGVNTARCMTCGQDAIKGLGAADPKRLEIGHYVAKGMGGRSDRTNLGPQCRRCNLWQHGQETESGLTGPDLYRLPAWLVNPDRWDADPGSTSTHWEAPIIPIDQRL